MNSYNLYLNRVSGITSYSAYGVFDYSTHNIASRNPPEMINTPEMKEEILQTINEGHKFSWNNVRIIQGDNERLINVPEAPAQSIRNEPSTYLSSGEDSDDEGDEYMMRPSPFRSRPLRQRPSRLESDIHIWDIINTLDWKDTDEQTMSKSYIDNRLSVTEIDILKHGIPQFVDQLMVSFGPLDLFANMTQSNLNNFLWHIVAKKKDFYDNILVDPLLSLPWLEYKLYQPLYDFLNLP